MIHLDKGGLRFCTPRGRYFFHSLATRQIPRWLSFITGLILTDARISEFYWPGFHAVIGIRHHRSRFGDVRTAKGTLLCDSIQPCICMKRGGGMLSTLLSINCSTSILSWNTRCPPKYCLMLDQRRRGWTNTELALDIFLVLAERFHIKSYKHNLPRDASGN